MSELSVMRADLNLVSYVVFLRLMCRCSWCMRMNTISEGSEKFFVTTVFTSRVLPHYAC